MRLRGSRVKAFGVSRTLLGHEPMDEKSDLRFGRLANTAAARRLA